METSPGHGRVHHASSSSFLGAMFGIGLLGVIISYLSTGMEQGLRDSVADNITTAINVLSIGAWMVGVVVGVPWMIIEAVKRRRAR